MGLSSDSVNPVLFGTIRPKEQAYSAEICSESVAPSANNRRTFEHTTQLLVPPVLMASLQVRRRLGWNI